MDRHEREDPAIEATKAILRGGKEEENRPFRFQLQNKKIYYIFGYLIANSVIERHLGIEHGEPFGEDQATGEDIDAVVTDKFAKALRMDLDPDDFVPIELSYREVSTVGETLLMLGDSGKDQKKTKIQRKMGRLYEHVANAFVKVGGKDNTAYRERLQRLT